MGPLYDLPPALEKRSEVGGTVQKAPGTEAPGTKRRTMGSGRGMMAAVMEDGYGRQWRNFKKQTHLTFPLVQSQRDLDFCSQKLQARDFLLK